MLRIFVSTLIAMLACLVTMAEAQDGWRTGQPSLLIAQSGQIAGQNVQPSIGLGQVPGPAAMQNGQNPAQYTAGSYDLPPQTKPNTQQQLAITRLTQFPLPFSISAANREKLNSVELVYSLDRGQNWYSYQSLPPSETKFDFNVPEDGEYWFVFRAQLKSGEVKQLGATPAARVLVDTVPPKLSLGARRNASGEVTIEWTVEDVALKNGHPTISLSYDGNISWMTLATDVKNVKREGNRETGQVAFWPRHEAEAVEIRCEVEDAAENKEIQTTRLVLKASPNETAAATSTLTPMTDNASTGETIAVQPAQDVSVVPPRPMLTHRVSHSVSATDDTNSPTPTVSDEKQSIVAQSTPAPQPLTAAPDNTLVDLLKTMGDSAPSAVSADVTRRYADNATVPGGTGSTQPPAGTLPANTPPPAMLSNVPPARYVPANANTPGNPSPNDTSTAPPPLGSQPSGTPVVSQETTPFPGKISLVSLGEFGEQKCIIVRWLPGGTPFAESKVDLYRSETRHGPWRPIAFDLKNSGEHYWLVSAADKMPFYLRVDLRSTQGLFTDFTVQTISLPLSFGESGTPPPAEKP